MYVRSDTEIEQNQMHPHPFTHTVYVRPAPDGAARQATAVFRVQSWGLCTPALVNGNACRCSETSPLTLRLSTLRRALDPRPCTLPVRLCRTARGVTLCTYPSPHRPPEFPCARRAVAIS